MIYFPILCNLKCIWWQRPEKTTSRGLEGGVMEIQLMLHSLDLCCVRGSRRKVTHVKVYDMKQKETAHSHLKLTMK